jgi:hypothetical protein
VPTTVLPLPPLLTVVFAVVLTAVVLPPVLAVVPPLLAVTLPPMLVLPELRPPRLFTALGPPSSDAELQPSRDVVRKRA